MRGASVDLRAARQGKGNTRAPDTAHSFLSKKSELHQVEFNPCHCSLDQFSVH